MVDRPQGDQQGVRDDPPWSQWTRDEAAGIEREGATVAPMVRSPETRFHEDIHIWDTWLLRDVHGDVTSVDGWRVAFSLTAPADVLPSNRHDVAAIQYFYSDDGEHWRPGGELFADGAFGQRQWSGSAVYDDGALYVYYTAVGLDGDDELSEMQRIAGATTDSLTATADHFVIDGPWAHEIVLEPDGKFYETETQTEELPYTFRDPWFFEDPVTGETCLLFEGNVPIDERANSCSDAPSGRQYTGCVGMAVSPTGDPLDWELRPPIMDGCCVNHELERPHVVRWDGRYYLFVSTHRHMFAPGLEGYDALYGWVADSLDGAYRPLNGTGLVVTNPESAPFQSYSWMVYAHRNELLIQYFTNYDDFAGDTLEEISKLPEAEQSARFGGTLGPTLRLAIEGDRSRILGTLDPWHLPTAEDPLPKRG